MPGHFGRHVESHGATGIDIFSTREADLCSDWRIRGRSFGLVLGARLGPRFGGSACLPRLCDRRAKTREESFTGLN
jgi:hypothetical protein